MPPYCSCAPSARKARHSYSTWNEVIYTVYTGFAMPVDVVARWCAQGYVNTSLKKRSEAIRLKTWCEWHHRSSLETCWGDNEWIFIFLWTISLIRLLFVRNHLPDVSQANVSKSVCRIFFHNVWWLLWKIWNLCINSWFISHSISKLLAYNLNLGIIRA